MSEVQESGTTPTLEVRVLRDGAVVERMLVESADEANAIVATWSDVEGVVCEVEDLLRSGAPGSVLEPRPWEVDADDAQVDVDPYDEDDSR